MLKSNLIRSIEFGTAVARRLKRASQKWASAGVCSSQSLSAVAESIRVKAERELTFIMSPFEDQAPM